MKERQNQAAKKQQAPKYWLPNEATKSTPKPQQSTVTLAGVDQEALARALDQTGVTLDELASYWTSHGVRHCDPEDQHYFDEEMCYEMVREAHRMMVQR